MIFTEKLAKAIRDGRKTQTRRLKKSSHRATRASCPPGMLPRVVEVIDGNRVVWRIDQTYAVQPGRTEKGIARFRLLKIKREYLQSISEKDARAEGVPKLYRTPRWMAHEGRNSFKNVWDQIHKKAGTRWKDNPEIFVLEFELIGDRR